MLRNTQVQLRILIDILCWVKLKSNRNKRWLNARGARLGVLKMDRKGGFLGWRKGLAGEKGGKGGGLVWWRGCEGA